MAGPSVFHTYRRFAFYDLTHSILASAEGVDACFESEGRNVRNIKIFTATATKSYSLVKELISDICPRVSQFMICHRTIELLHST